MSVFARKQRNTQGDRRGIKESTKEKGKEKRVNSSDNTYQKIERMLTRCDENQLKVILATTEALLSIDKKPLAT